jgi:hypothetical protein
MRHIRPTTNCVLTCEPNSSQRTFWLSLPVAACTADSAATILHGLVSVLASMWQACDCGNRIPRTRGRYGEDDGQNKGACLVRQRRPLLQICRMLRMPFGHECWGQQFLVNLLSRSRPEMFQRCAKGLQRGTLQCTRCPPFPPPPRLLRTA